MKNLKYQLIYILSIFFLLNSCTEEIEVQSSFPFEIEGSFRIQNIRDVPSFFSVEIIPERVVTTNTYNLTYSIISGSANLTSEDGTPINEGENISLENLKIEGFITPTSLDDILISISVDNKQGIKEQKEFTIKVLKTNFSLEVANVSGSVLVGEPVLFNASLIQSSSETIKYGVILNTESKGKVRYNDTIYEKLETINLTEQDIANSKWEFEYFGTDGGTHNIEFLLFDLSLPEKRVSAKGTAEFRTFDYNLIVPSEVKKFAGESIDYTVSYTENSNFQSGANLSYNVDGQGQVIFEGSPLAQAYSLTDDLTFELTHTYTSIGTSTINWIYQNNSGSNDQYTTNIIVENLPYNPEIQGNGANSFEDFYPLTLVINPELSIQQYKLVNIETSLGQVYRNDTPVSGELTLDYITELKYRASDGTARQTHSIEFIIEDEYGQRKTVNHSVKIADEIIPYVISINEKQKNNEIECAGGFATLERFSEITIKLEELINGFNYIEIKRFRKDNSQVYTVNERLSLGQTYTINNKRINFFTLGNYTMEFIDSKGKEWNAKFKVSSDFRTERLRDDSCKDTP